MYERDFILRLIAGAGQMLRATRQAVREQRPDDALAGAREAILALTDTDPVLIDTMTGDGLVTFLSAGGRVDVLRSYMLAEVLLARAEAHDQLGDGVRAARDRDRARALLDAAAPEAEGEDAERIAALREQLA